MKMKKVMALVLVMLMVLGLAACGGNKTPDPKPQSGVAFEEVKGVTTPDFKLKICGVKITQDDVIELTMYKATSNTVNSSGTPGSKVYVGYKLSDILTLCEVTGTFGKITPSATDNYTFDIEAGKWNAENVLIAVTEDGNQFKDGPWFAPMDSGTTGDFLKGLAKIEIEGASSPKASGGNDNPSGEGKTVELADPVKEDKSDKITFGDFCFKLNGKEVKNADLEGLKIYRITVTTKNSKEVVSESKYSGYVLSDVLNKLGISNASSVKAVASDNYESELAADLIANEFTIIAIEKDKETGENGTVWLAPCSEQVSSMYAKDVVELIVK